jgi:hypothetical protein
MNFNIDRAPVTVYNIEYVDARIELSPLTRPILPDFLFPSNPTALGSLGPADTLAHERECGVDVPPVESGVRLRDQLSCSHAL